MVLLRIRFIRPCIQNSGRLIFFFTRNEAKSTRFCIGEILGKIEISKTKNLVAFLMSKMDSTQNFSPENGITCHISEYAKFLKIVPEIGLRSLKRVI